MPSKVLRLAPLLVALLRSMAGQPADSPSPPIWPDGMSAADAGGRRVFLSPDLHSMIVLVPESPDGPPSGPLRIVRVALRNDLEPSVSVVVNRSPGGLVSYRYAVSNGRGAADAVGAFTLIVPAGAARLDVANPSASGRAAFAGGVSPGGPAIAVQPFFPEEPKGRNLLWFQQDGQVIRPGDSMSGFGIDTSWLPGFTTAWLSSGELLAIDQSWPPEIFRQLTFIEDRRWREKAIVTIGPLFDPETSKPAIAERLRAEWKNMEKAGLLDSQSPFLREIGQLLRDWKPALSVSPAVVRPATPFERSVAEALGIALGIRFE